MADLRYCSARMYEYACELRYDHDGDHRQGHITWERLSPGRVLPPEGTEHGEE